MKTIREQISVDGSKMNLFSAQPDGGGPLPAVVVIQHSIGRLILLGKLNPSFYCTVAKTFAQRLPQSQKCMPCAKNSKCN